MTAADLSTDLTPTRESRQLELQAYGRMIRLLGRRVPQPAPSALAPVLHVPGFGSGDVSLTVLARALRRAGHRTFGSKIGANVGCTDDMVERLTRRVEAVVEAEARPVALLGHSRGAMITKLVAIRRPELVDSLVVLAGPVTGQLQVAAHVRRQLEWLFRLNARGVTRVMGADCVTGECAERIAAELSGPFPAGIAYTSVYSRLDAIIDWHTCLDPAATCVEVRASHTGMATDPATVREVVRGLAAVPVRCDPNPSAGLPPLHVGTPILAERQFEPATSAPPDHREYLMTTTTSHSTESPGYDVVDVLTRDHHDVLDLLDTIASSSDKHTQRDIADTVIAEIVRHSVAEEMYVYPAMRDKLPGGTEQVQHDIEEHQELEETLKRLEGLSADDANFAAVVARTRSQLEHHASDEESTQFPLLREHLTPDELQDLGRKVETAKKIAPTRPHPSAPHSELFHKAFGPGVGLVDKLRDAVSGRASNT